MAKFHVMRGIILGVSIVSSANVVTYANEQGVKIVSEESLFDRLTSDENKEALKEKAKNAWDALVDFSIKADQKANTAQKKVKLYRKTQISSARPSARHENKKVANSLCSKGSATLLCCRGSQSCLAYHKRASDDPYRMPFSDLSFSASRSDQIISSIWFSLQMNALSALCFFMNFLYLVLCIACVFTREHTRRYLTRYSLSSV